jgi:hypothetical protein
MLQLAGVVWQVIELRRNKNPQAKACATVRYLTKVNSAGPVPLAACKYAMVSPA